MDSLLNDIGKVFLSGLISAGIVMGLSWGTVEYVFSEVASRFAKRVAALALGLVMVGLAHYGTLTSFGEGPRGWALAILSGFLGGGLAPLFHDQVVKRWLPGLKKPPKGGGPGRPMHPRPGAI